VTAPVDDTPARILAAAGRLFAERGVAAVSLSDVAAEVGLTKSAVAYHFHPKEALVRAVLHDAAEGVAALLAAPPPSTNADREQLLVDYLDLLVRHRELIPMLVTATRTPPTLGSVLEPLRDEILRRLTAPQPTPEDQARAWSALGAIHIGLYRTLHLPRDLVRDAVAAAALAAYRSRP